MENISDNESKKASRTVQTEPYDFFLSLLLSFADGVANLPVTLLVKGLLVSGSLITDKEYLESFADGSVHKTIHDVIAKGELKMPPEDELKKAEDESKKKAVTHIHLRDAKVLCGGHLPISVGLWRGRIDSIDGFFLGNLSAQAVPISEGMNF